MFENIKRKVSFLDVRFEDCNIEIENNLKNLISFIYGKEKVDRKKDDSSSYVCICKKDKEKI
ncbi:MAG: hypothetical protein M0P12_13065 [Paludibacteraceae bacterium]|nr:hypothetical protein [Paludibacteraceae bacterium]